MPAPIVYNPYDTDPNCKKKAEYLYCVIVLVDMPDEETADHWFLKHISFHSFNLSFLNSPHFIYIFTNCHSHNSSFFYVLVDIVSVVCYGVLFGFLAGCWDAVGLLFFLFFVVDLFFFFRCKPCINPWCGARIGGR